MIKNMFQNSLNPYDYSTKLGCPKFKLSCKTTLQYVTKNRPKNRYYKVKVKFIDLEFLK